MAQQDPLGHYLVAKHRVEETRNELSKLAALFVKLGNDLSALAQQTTFAGLRDVDPARLTALLHTNLEKWPNDKQIEKVLSQYLLATAVLERAKESLSPEDRETLGI